ncbi:MAG: LptF/LptG family permease, partial [Candidatus Omnitrophica bacterium]|nr:LptF/LptG family permease [Candidatus Omnitrophota bacterium]
MRILDRYILKSVLSIFIGCLLTFIFLYVIIDIFSHLEDLLKQKIHFDIILQYYSSSFPFIFVQVTPIACLLATIYTFAKLNRDNEIIAMRSAGLSIFDVTKTVFIFGIITSVMVFLVNDRLVPQSQVLNQKIKTFMESGRKRSEQKEEEVINNLCMYGIKNRLFFVTKFSPTSETMEGITILEHNEHQDITKKIVANKAKFVDGIWLFSQSITYEFDTNGQIIKEPRYLEEEIMDIPESPYDFLSQRQSPDFMNI